MQEIFQHVLLNRLALRRQYSEVQEPRNHK